MTDRKRAYLGLFVAAFLFGVTFVAIKDAVVTLPPLAFVGWRFLLGAGVLFIFARPHGRSIWVDGLVAGSLLFAGFSTQTLGLAETSASNSALITGLYVVFTPLLAALVRRTSPAITTMFGALLSVVGLGFLTVTSGFSLNGGDLLTVLSAVAFAAHIVSLARFAPRHAVVPFTAIQLLVVAVFGLIASAVFEGLPLPVASVLPALIGTGVVVSAGAFMLHVSAQRVIGPSRTAIVLSAEPVFAAATAAVVLGERLTARGWLGAALIMAGVYVVLAFAPPEEADSIVANPSTGVH
jgi:drug/metabolite transporter (DMT)-like permease